MLDPLSYTPSAPDSNRKRNGIMLQKLDKFRVRNPQAALANFHDGLRRALTLSKEELDRRVAEADAARSAKRVENGKGKPGPKAALIHE